MVFKPRTFYGEDASVLDPDAGVVAETRVAEALARAADLDASNVSVTSVDSQIVLQGTVAFPEEVAIAGDIASRVSGVSEVENLIAVAGTDSSRVG